VFRSIGGIRFLDFGGTEVNWRELNIRGLFSVEMLLPKRTGS
jgi:hypothetical protein